MALTKSTDRLSGASYKAAIKCCMSLATCASLQHTSWGSVCVCVGGGGGYPQTPLANELIHHLHGESSPGERVYSNYLLARDISYTYTYMHTHAHAHTQLTSPHAFQSRSVYLPNEVEKGYR